jgi:cytochrome c oxidase assembly protein subunit 15
MALPRGAGSATSRETMRTATPASHVGAAAPASVRDDRAIALWLVGCCAMVFAMVVIGGITRLTQSGLSIMEWAPISGALPPLNEAEWQRLFALYQQIPEYQEINRGMTLAEFKGIFWWEWVHRLWGRLIGVVFLAPFLWFLCRGRIRRGLAPRLALIFALGAAQGGLGWFMVASGFTERVDVSQYRLVAHLALALAIYAAMLWTALGLLGSAERWPVERRLRPHLSLALGFLVATIAMGGFTAGLHGGLVYNSFPLMGGEIAPSDLWSMAPAWLNFFENPPTAQFVHRWLAVATALVLLALRWRERGAGSLPVRAVTTMALVQVGLGIATLLLVVPIPLAALHQAGAVALLTLVLWALHGTRGAPTGASA